MGYIKVSDFFFLSTILSIEAVQRLMGWGRHTSLALFSDKRQNNLRLLKHHSFLHSVQKILIKKPRSPDNVLPPSCVRNNRDSRTPPYWETTVALTFFIEESKVKRKSEWDHQSAYHAALFDIHDMFVFVRNVQTSSLPTRQRFTFGSQSRGWWE